MRIDRLRSGTAGPASRQVYRALRDAIIATELAPGQRISENELAERLAVSRTPVREALIRLRDERFVQIVPQLGTFVTRISTARRRRRAVHPRVARVRRRAARRDARRRRRHRRAARARAPPGRGLRARRPRALRACSTTSSTPRSASSPGHSVAWEVAQRVKGHLNRVRRLSLPQPRYLEEMVAEHRLVLDALAQRRPRRGRGDAAPPPADGPVGAAGDPRAAPRLLRGGATTDGDRDRARCAGSTSRCS